jgi:hypothetical protein
VLWCQAGRSADEYWRQTPRTLVLALDGFRAECRRQSDLATAGAWYGEMFARQKKLKPLKEYLTKPPERGARMQRPEEMLAILKGLPGVKVRKVG